MALVAATDGFTPAPETLTQACEMLTVSRNPADPRYAMAATQLESLLVQPEFLVHVTYIFARLSPVHLPDDVRQLAGLVVKQGAHKAPLSALPAQVQRFVRAELLVALSDPHSATVRHTAGSVVTALAARNSRGSGGLATTWPELLPSIAALLDAAQAGGGSGEAALLGAAGGLSCVAKLCEDGRLDEAAAEAFVPRLLAFLGAPSPDSRVPALTALLHLCGPPMASALAKNLGAFMQGLSALTGDPSPAVRQLVCQCIVALLEAAPEQVVPAFSALAEFMLHASGNSAQEPEVATAALEFWVPCCHCAQLGASTEAEPAFLAVLPRLIPLLLNGMRYSDEEAADFMVSQEDSTEPDRAEDLRPIFHKKGKSKGGSGHRKLLRQSSEGGSSTGDNGSGELRDGVADEDDEASDDDDDDNANDEVETYSLRKRCAATLDKLSERFGGDVVLPLVLPELLARFGAESTWVREAAILALGALQTGADEGLDAHLPQLFPYLLEHMAHAGSPQLREISCWAVGRYLGWAVQQAWVNSADGSPLEEPDCGKLLPLTHALLARVSDTNKKVQQFACSTLAIYVGACQEYECDDAFRGAMIQPIFACLLSALSTFQTKSSVIMFDTLGTLCEVLCDDIASDASLCSALLPPLLSRWEATADTDPLLFPLFECLASVAAAAKLQFQAYALPVLQRCCRLIEMVLVADATGQVDPATGEPPDKQLIASSLDLADGLLRGVEENFAFLLESCARAGGGPQLMQFLPACLRDEDDDVRQAALGLLGDLAVHAPQALMNSAGSTAAAGGALVGAAASGGGVGAGDAALAAADLVPLVRESLSATVYGRKVASNAAWALGELAVAFGSAVIGPSCSAACWSLIAILSDDECHPNLLENTAVCVGRLASACSSHVATCAASLAPVWLPALQHVSSPDDRHQAFSGLVALAQVAWQATVAGANYPAFLGAVASWCYYDPPPPELKAQLQAMISAASAELRGTDPESYLGLLEDDCRGYLLAEYSFA